MGGKKEELMPSQVITPKMFYRITKKLDNWEEKSLVTFLYLTGARITEALNVRFGDFIRTIHTETLGAVPVVQIKVLKRKEEIWRVIPIWLYEDEYLFLGKTMSDYIKNKYDNIIDVDAHTYYVWYSDRKSPGPGQMHRSRKWAWQVCKKLGHPPHFWRHNRALYLSNYKGWNEYKLVNYFQWSNPKTSYIYTRSRNPEQFLSDFLQESHSRKSR